MSPSATLKNPEHAFKVAAHADWGWIIMINKKTTMLVFLILWFERFCKHFSQCWKNITELQNQQLYGLNWPTSVHIWCLWFCFWIFYSILHFSTGFYFSRDYFSIYINWNWPRSVHQLHQTFSLESSTKYSQLCL